MSVINLKEKNIICPNNWYIHYEYDLSECTNACKVVTNSGTNKNIKPIQILWIGKKAVEKFDDDDIAYIARVCAREYPEFDEVLKSSIIIVKAGMPGIYVDIYGNKRTLEDWINAPKWGILSYLEEELDDNEKE